MRNETKDKILITVFLVSLVVLIILLACSVVKLFAYEPTQEQRYQTMWEYTESMPEQEYYETFLKENK